MLRKNGSESSENYRVCLGFNSWEVNIRKWEDHLGLHLVLNLLKGTSTVMKNGSLSLGELGFFLYIYKEKKQEVPYIYMGRTSPGRQTLQRLETLVREQLESWFAPVPGIMFLSPRCVNYPSIGRVIFLLGKL